MCGDEMKRDLSRDFYNPRVADVIIDAKSIYEKFKTVSVITADDWYLIRDYYDMLFMYILHSLELVWSKGGYRDALNIKIAKDQSDDQQNGFRSFKQYLAEEYNCTSYELIGFVLQPVKHLRELQENLFVENVYGTPVRPHIPPNNNSHLQPVALKKIKLLSMRIKGRN